MTDFKKVFLTICAATLPAIGWCQFDPQRSQYMFSTSAYNPASVAQNGMCNVLGVYRLQWAGFSGAPKDVFVSGELPFTIGGVSNGVGLSFQNETIGLFENQAVSLQYSYKFQAWNGTMGLGLSAGFFSQDFDTDKADFTGNGNSPVDGDDVHKKDDGIVEGEQHDAAFAAGLGAFFSNESMYLGLSVANLNAPAFEVAGERQIRVARSLHLMGGYDLPLTNGDFHLKPSALFRTDFSSSQLDMTCLLDVKKKFHGGLGYRLGDSFEFLLGANLLNGLFLGYAYDLPLSGMIKSGGSHELCLKYAFKLELAKKNKYKSERIL